MSYSLEPSLQFITQELLYKQLTLIFPLDEIHFNTKKTTNVKYPSGNYMEFDIWIPSHSLCFEFQDSYHYVTTWYYQNPQMFIQQLDNIKSEMIRQQGYSLIEVPLWWDGSQMQLAHTIHFNRPDLNLNVEELVGDPIGLNTTEELYQDSLVPHIGELMLASVPRDTNTLSIDTWWIGEKYDGIRCYWNFEVNAAYTRYGNELSLLPEFISYMPRDTFLDSELWLGRGNYSMFALSGMPHSSWQSMRIVSFDTPSLSQSITPYENRFANLLRALPIDHPFINIAVRFSPNTNSGKNVGILSNCVLDHGGEGLILQKMNSLYEKGRSPNVLKLKKAQADQEGIIVKVGKNKSVSLLLPQGDELVVPPEDVLIPVPKVGDIVTFSFDQSSRRSIPSNPKIFRVRRDIVWEDIARERKAPTYSTKPHSYWTPKTMRHYMEIFAKKKNMDPLIQETWISSFGEFVKYPSSRAILSKFKSGYLQALQYLFPEVYFDPSLFQQAYFKVENRRKLFENYARENGFDPLVADNWYSQSANQILTYKGAARVITYHGGSVVKTLLDLFPNIGLDKSKLTNKGEFWDNSKNRRNFFESFARRHGFDPLIAKNWNQFSTSISKNKLLSTPGIHLVLGYHSHSLWQALSELFTGGGGGGEEEQEGELQREKLVTEKKYWRKAANRRKFFENFAKNNGFDPLVAENWSKQSRKKILAAKGASRVIAYHKSLSHALVDLFPEVFKKENSQKNQKIKIFASKWDSALTRRKFFERYAVQKNFDFLVAANWYHQPLFSNLASTRAAKKIMKYHNNNMTKALVELFPDVKFHYEKFGGALASEREFFEKYARAHSFDPLNPEEWYSQSRQKIMATTGAYQAVKSYSGSVTKALVTLFPNMGLDISRFGISNKYWQHPTNRRKFFENFAKENKFDPLVAHNWYSAHSNINGTKNIIQYHKNSIVQALVDLFPDVGLNPLNFEIYSVNRDFNKLKKHQKIAF